MGYPPQGYPKPAGVTAHTALTDKEVAGVIDHADGSVTLAKLIDGILSADAPGRARMADGFITTAKLLDGLLSADAAGRAKMADDYIILGKILNGIFTADAAGRAKFAASFVNTALLENDCVTLDKVLDNEDLSGIGVAALARILKSALPAPGVANRVLFDTQNRFWRDTGTAFEKLNPDLEGGEILTLLDHWALYAASNSFLRLPNLPSTTYTHYMLPVGKRFLFAPEANITAVTRGVNLYSLGMHTLAALPANCGGSMLAGVKDGRYIYFPQGFSAAVTRGPNFYRYDLLTDSWAAMAAITTLNPGYLFNYNNGVVWDGGDYVFVIGGYDGVDKATFRYQISTNTWAELADNPQGSTNPAGAVVMIGDYIYIGSQTTTRFERYRISTDSWESLTALPFSHVAGGLVQDETDPDKIWYIGGSGGVGRVHRYSISGNSWTDLTPTATGIPGEMQGKGVFLTRPFPMVLQYRRTTNQMYVYKI